MLLYNCTVINTPMKICLLSNIELYTEVSFPNTRFRISRIESNTTQNFPTMSDLILSVSYPSLNSFIAEITNKSLNPPKAILNGESGALKESIRMLK